MMVLWLEYQLDLDNFDFKPSPLLTTLLLSTLIVIEADILDNLVVVMLG